MNELPENERKPDLIDLVRAGHKIEIYEAKPLLKEGDVLKDWQELPSLRGTTKVLCREVVGEQIVSHFLWKRSTYDCEYCGTPMHTVRRETRHIRKGRDGREYIKDAFSESPYVGRICPLCEYRDQEYSTY